MFPFWACCWVISACLSFSKDIAFSKIPPNPSPKGLYWWIINHHDSHEIMAQTLCLLKKSSGFSTFGIWYPRFSTRVSSNTGPGKSCATTTARMEPGKFRGAAAAVGAVSKPTLRFGLWLVEKKYNEITQLAVFFCLKPLIFTQHGFSHLHFHQVGIWFVVYPMLRLQGGHDIRIGTFISRWFTARCHFASHLCSGWVVFVFPFVGFAD